MGIGIENITGYVTCWNNGTNGRVYVLVQSLKSSSIVVIISTCALILSISPFCKYFTRNALRTQSKSPCISFRSFNQPAVP